MLHDIDIALSIVLSFFVLCASIYITSFAILGVNERPHPAPVSAYTRFLVLVPAHNEGHGIKPTIRSLQKAKYPSELVRIAVIADNCTDNTMEVARACGVETWIRNDPQNPGKGQALSWALDKAALGFDLVAIVDPDTEVDPAFFSAMDSAYAASLQEGREDVVLQGRYIFAKASQPASRFEQFTIASKAAVNSFFYRPRSALGLANLIQGNGFCISHTVLEHVPFDAASAVEDAEYAVSLALNGIQVVYVDEAQVVTRMTQQLKDAAPQRLRWASDIFSLLVHSAPGLLGAAIRQRKWQLAEMAPMLLLSSRLLLIYATLISIALLDCAYPFRHFDVAATALSVSLLLQSIYLYLVLRKADSAPAPFRTIVIMPFYVGILGAMQLGAVLGFRKRQWNRSMW